MKKIMTLEDKLTAFRGNEDDATKLILSIFTLISEAMSRCIQDEMYEDCMFIQRFVDRLIRSINEKFRRYDSLDNYESVSRLRRMTNEIFKIG